MSIIAVAWRLLLAYGLFRGSGFKADVSTFAGWAEILGRDGPGTFYAHVVSTYPPGYLYVLWATGLVVLAGGFVLPLALRFLPAIQTVEDEPDVGEEPS